MNRTGAFVTNLELRESNPDGTEKAGLSHKAEGMFLLHVLEVAGVGEPKGSITILHDAGDHGGRYEALASTLAEGGWAIALPDMRGHGKSEGPRGHSAGLAEVLRDIEAVQDHLAYRLPDAPRLLVGLGLGSVYAVAYAINHPDAVGAMVLASPNLAPRYEAPRKPGGLKGLFAKVGPTSAGSLGHTPEALTSLPEQQRLLAADPLVHNDISAHTLGHLPATLERVGAGFARLDVPTLVLVGEDDPLVDQAAVSRWCASNPRAERRALPGRRHDLFHDEGAETLAADVARWIATAIR